MSNNIIDIIERFQTRHALQEECEVKKFDASTNSAAAAGVPDKNGEAKNNIFEMEEVRVWTVAVPGNTEWSPPHDGRDRMVVTLGRIRQLPRDSDSAFPARWACIPSNSDFKVPNETYHTRNFMIVEFNNANRPRLGGDGGKAPERLDQHALRPNDRPTVAIDRKEQHDESSA